MGRNPQGDRDVHAIFLRFFLSKLKGNYFPATRRDHIGKAIII
jgi:hypothetical protein